METFVILQRAAAEYLRNFNCDDRNRLESWVRQPLSKKDRLLKMHSILYNDEGTRNNLIRRTAKILAPVLKGRIRGAIGRDGGMLGIEEHLLLFPSFETLWFCINHVDFDPMKIAIRVLMVTITEISRLEKIYRKFSAECIANARASPSMNMLETVA